MEACEQTQGQSVYQHGISVSEHLADLITLLKTGSSYERCSPNSFKYPDWFHVYRNDLLGRLLPEDILTKYAIFHDCGKPYCLTIDAEGRRHFPDHAQKSYETWMKIDGDPQVGQLILHDMDIHTIKAVDIPAFAAMPEAISLLLSGLAEIHSNAQLFGGLESLSFKVKWKQIDSRGRALCKLLFGERKPS